MIQITEIESAAIEKQDEIKIPSYSNSTLSHSMSQASLKSEAFPELDKVDSKPQALHNKNYKLIKVIGKGTYSTVYLSSLDINIKNGPVQEIFDQEQKGFDSPQTEEIVSQLSEVLQCSKKVSIQQINESIVNFENIENVEYQAFKIIQRPNFNKGDKTYLD